MCAGDGKMGYFNQNEELHASPNIDDGVTDRTINAIRRERKVVISEQDIVTMSPEEDELVVEWRSYGLTWKDVKTNLELRR